MASLLSWGKKRLQQAENIVSRGIAQINPADNGRTWSNPQGNRGRGPAPSAFHQLTHNGVTNAVGNVVKPLPHELATKIKTEVPGLAPGLSFVQHAIVQPVARTVPEVAASIPIKTPVTGHTLTPPKFLRPVVGNTPVKSIQEDVRGVYRDVKSGKVQLPGNIPVSPELATPYAAAAALLHLGQDLPIAGAAAKGATKAASLARPVVQDATKAIPAFVSRNAAKLTPLGEKGYIRLPGGKQVNEPLYHGTNAQDAIHQQGFKLPQTKGEWNPIKSGSTYGKGIYLTNEKGRAAQYVGKDGQVLNVGINKNAKIYTPKDVIGEVFGSDTGYGDPAKITAKFQSKGYDGLRIGKPNGKGPHEIVVFDPKKVKPLTEAGVVGKNVGKVATEKPQLPRPSVLKDQQGGVRIPSFGKRNRPDSASSPPKITTPKPSKEVAGKTPRFNARVQANPETPAEVRKAISGHYEIQSNPATLKRAADEINANPEAAVARVLGPEYKPTVHNHATAMLLAEKARKSGNYPLMTSLLERVGNEAHNPGQAIQILAQWGKTTPEGIVKYAQKVVREGTRLPDGTPKATLTAEQAKSFGTRMEEIQKLSAGRDKNLATAKLLKDIHDLVPSSGGSKIRNLLYYAQLLNPKTAIRNIGGNAIFGTAENISDTLAAPIDRLISGFRTGILKQEAPRSIYVPDVVSQARVGIKGAKEAAQEAKLGVNLSGTTGQYEAYGRQAAFQNKAGRALDQALAVELSVPDRFALSGAEFQSLKNQLRAEGVSNKLLTPDKIWQAKLGKENGIKITQDMLERSGELGKYRTFQDNSVPARLLTALKSGLNLKKEAGAGNFVLNYPKTPGNLLARGLDYSPAGFIKTAIEMARPAFKRGPFNQEKFVRSLTRALVGSGGLVGTGAALQGLGIITGRPDPNKSVNAAAKALGLGQYKINVSALKRYVLSGFDASQAKLRPGDTQVSYDWAQPASFALTMGANLNETKGSKKGAVGKISDSLGKGAGEVVDAMNSLAEQPVLQGLTTLTGSSGGGLTQGMIQSAAGAPSSFIPTILNQINQLTNNTARSTYSPNPLETALKKVENKIPGVSTTLQPQIDVLGRPAERYQGGTNNPFNVFLNPAFVSKYMPNDVLDEARRLQDSTGESKQFPKQIRYTQKINGENKQLTPEQVTKLQTYVGQNASSQLSNLVKSSDYKSAPDDKKVDMISSILTDVSQAGRKVVLGDKKELSSGAQAVVDKEQVIIGGTDDGTVKSRRAKYLRDYQKYQQGVKSGKLSLVEQSIQLPKLKKEAITSQYSKDVADLYGLSARKIQTYLDANPNDTELRKQVVSLDAQLYNAGLITRRKLSGSGTVASSGRGGRRSAKTKKQFSVPGGLGTSSIASNRTGVSLSRRAGGIKAKKPNVRVARAKTYKTPKIKEPRIVG